MYYDIKLYEYIMMSSIVKDKVIAIQTAANIATKLMEQMLTQIREYQCEDDPAENFYLMAHILGRMLFVSASSVELCGATYQINIDKESFIKWVNLIVKEHKLVGKKFYD